MDRTVIAFLIGLGIAIVFGSYVARRSNRAQRVNGGTIALAFHWVASTAIAGILPVVLTSLILGLGFGTAFPFALAFLATGWAALLLLAALDQPSHTIGQTEDRGWTREDAKKSY
jgi:hypothetical protein